MKQQSRNRISGDRLCDHQAVVALAGSSRLDEYTTAITLLENYLRDAERQVVARFQEGPSS